MRCDLHDDKHFIEGQNVTLEKGEAPEAADIVFVIQHHTCTQEPMEQLEEIAEKIYKAYKGYCKHHLVLLARAYIGSDTSIHFNR